MTRPGGAGFRRRALAVEQLQAARSAMGAAVADLLRGRVSTCSGAGVRRCPGWLVGPSGLVVCDTCARLSGYQDALCDADLHTLPAARRALARALGASHEAHDETSAAGLDTRDAGPRAVGY